MDVSVAWYLVKHRCVSYRDANMGAVHSCFSFVERIYPKVSGLSHNKITTINTRQEETQRFMAEKLTRLTHKTDTTAPSGIELYHLQFSLQAASPETFGYTLIYQEP
jgi:hypothetical protein